MKSLLDRIRSHDPRALARAMTLAENGDAALLNALDAQYASLPQPPRLGFTGPPGAGKSTLVSALVTHLRAQGAGRIGVLAIDPSSPFSGGSLLGDRLRMSEHTLDPEVFVRSMAARGHLGGLAAGCEDACDLLALAGHETVIVETVGVGQSEVEIAGVADTTVVVLTPASGDSVQALKAGVMEIADVVAINKADKPGAERLEEDIKEGLELRPHPRKGEPLWLPPVVKTTATTGEGVPGLAAALQRHAQFAAENGLAQKARTHRAEARMSELALAAFGSSLRSGKAAKAFDKLRARVARGNIAPRAAVAELMQSLGL